MRDKLLRVLRDLQEARREAQAEHDGHVAANLAAPADDGARDVQLEQSLATLVRLLSDAVSAVSDAVGTIDQRERVKKSA